VELFALIRLRRVLFNYLNSVGLILHFLLHVFVNVIFLMLFRVVQQK
jgi:hypothetical protein